jgi:anti-sigma28 factor (negative regulator of flagellin synthesis)
MKITSPSELLRQTEVASRSPEASSPKAVKAEAAQKAEAAKATVKATVQATVQAEEPVVTDTKLDSLKKSAMTTAESEHAARLMSVAMALQSGRYSVDIMRIADALTRQ